LDDQGKLGIAGYHAMFLALNKTLGAWQTKVVVVKLRKFLQEVQTFLLIVDISRYLWI
jgi:hypothetical protein